MMFRGNVDPFIMWILAFTIEIEKPTSAFGPKLWFCDDLHVSTSYWTSNQEGFSYFPPLSK
jgi:hypothetical protein